MKLVTALLYPLFALFLLGSFPSFAEQKQQLGKWDVHYMLMPTTLLDAEDCWGQIVPMPKA